MPRACRRQEPQRGAILVAGILWKTLNLYSLPANVPGNRRERGRQGGHLNCNTTKGVHTVAIAGGKLPTCLLLQVSEAIVKEALELGYVARVVNVPSCACFVAPVHRRMLAFNVCMSYCTSA